MVLSKEQAQTRYVVPSSFRATSSNSPRQIPRHRPPHPNTLYTYASRALLRAARQRAIPRILVARVQLARRVRKHTGPDRCSQGKHPPHRVAMFHSDSFSSVKLGHLVEHKANK
jgi:hypothetical protein